MVTTIRVIDPHDDRDLQAWHATYLAAESYERPYAAPFAYDEMRALVRAAPVGREVVSLVGEEDGVVVCAGGLSLPLKDNLRRASVVVHTHPDHRRRGHATRMLDRLEAMAVERGREVAAALQDHAYDLGPSGAGDPGMDLLAHRGYVLALGDVQRTLALPVDDARLAALAAEAAPHHRGYTVLSFVGPVPDDLVESYGRLVGTLVTEAPTGGLTVETEVHDVERVRADEAVLVEAGRTAYTTVALDRTGQVVAYTTLVVPEHDPGKVFQWGTLVHPDHRGHRLGVAVKAANHAELARHVRDRHTVLTWNAEVNAPMIAVNERLGYLPTARSAELQKQLG